MWEEGQEGSLPVAEVGVKVKVALPQILHLLADSHCSSETAAETHCVNPTVCLCVCVCHVCVCVSGTKPSLVKTHTSGFALRRWLHMMSQPK